MIDNFELITPLLKFPNNDIYYHLQIIRRGKDHPNLPSANRMIKAYFITDVNDLNFYKQEIKDLCKFFEARAYINLAPKSIRKTTMLQLKYLAQRTYEDDFQKIWKSWNTCAVKIKGEESRWVVDIDCSLEKMIYWWDIKEYINEKCEPVGNKIISIIPTKSGNHLITIPFNIKQFKEKYPDMDVHKNNPTLLYCL